MPEHELPRHIANVQRIASTSRTVRTGHRLDVPPPGRGKAILADLADDRRVEKHGASCYRDRTSLPEGFSLSYTTCVAGVFVCSPGGMQVASTETMSF